MCGVQRPRDGGLGSAGGRLDRDGGGCVGAGALAAGAGCIRAARGGLARIDRHAARAGRCHSLGRGLGIGRQGRRAARFTRWRCGAPAGQPVEHRLRIRGCWHLRGDRCVGRAGDRLIFGHLSGRIGHGRFGLTGGRHRIRRIVGRFAQSLGRGRRHTILGRRALCGGRVLLDRLRLVGGGAAPWLRPACGLGARRRRVRLRQSGCRRRREGVVAVLPMVRGETLLLPEQAGER